MNEDDHSNNAPNSGQSELHSIDFWSSRGNIGEKINLLVVLNLSVINLISAFIQSLKEENALSAELILALTMVQDSLSKMSKQPESGLEILEKIDKIHSTVSSMIKEFPNILTYSEVADIKPSMESIGLFSRNAVYLDKWGVVESLEKLISSYTNLSHLTFPNYYLAACKELLRYEGQKETSVYNQHEIIKIPSFKLRVLISKLLREAPAARLLQNLRRMFPTEHDINPTSEEQNTIQKIVERYYKAISDYQEKILTLQDSLRISTGILRNYNLGTGDMESRIPNVSFNVTKEIQIELEESSGDDFKQYILSETIILIQRLNDSMLENEKFIFYLKRLK